MPVVPVLMVLYTDCSTEVRYSDGGRLILSPCGSAFRYHLPLSADRHPIQGGEVVQQRSAFVTSQYRQKVIEALDFRNRFASSPYICPQLFPKGDVVLLHSNIVEVLWPELSEETEVLQDGSIKLTSRDEHASLILSPHGHDVTVCYLSKVSTPPPTHQPDMPKRKHSSPAECRSRHVSGGSNSGLSDKSDSSSRTKSKSDRHSKKSRSKSKPNGAQFGSLSVQPSVYSAFIKVPKKSSSHSRQSSNPKYSDGESSTNSLQSLDSVTSSVEDELCSSYRDLNIQCKTQPAKKTTSNHGMGVPKCGPSHLHRISQSNCSSLNVSPNLSPINREISNGDGQSASSPTNSLLPENQSKCRQYYCWVTQHVSCSDSPLCWSYPIHLMRQRWEALQQQGYISGVHNGSTIPSTSPKDSKCQSQLTQTNGSFASQLPSPVPLSCPGQHLHSWSSSDLDLPTASGKVKVLMSEGVIYRLIRQISLRQVEIYPGDNSVVSSQGLTGHFFRHIIPRADNCLVEEKTYSVQVPPLDYAGSPYSLSKLIQKGAQLFASIGEGGTIHSANGFFCWQFQDGIGEEMSVPVQVIKDEHSVPGLGKFLAFTNGKIRVVFADRTALDMVSHDHTPGCHGDHKHSTSEVCEWSVYDSSKARVWGELIPLGCCRLLLPSGEYTLVSLQSPGQYKMYVDYALEWAAWSATPLKDRPEFYATRSNTHTDFSPDSELRKINCFNYVVENTVLKQQALCPSAAGDFGNFVSGDGLGHSSSKSLMQHSLTHGSDKIQSFDDVRRALQKTSQVIHDIDSLLSTQK